MVAVKDMIFEADELTRALELLAPKYHNISFYLTGSKVHTAKGLAADKVLVRAWGKKDEAN